MIAVGIGNNIRQLELEGIASANLENNVIKADNFDRLDDIKEQLIESICNSKSYNAHLLTHSVIKMYSWIKG